MRIFLEEVIVTEDVYSILTIRLCCVSNLIEFFCLSAIQCKMYYSFLFLFEKDTTVPKLYEWAKDGKEPLRTYAC